MSQTLANYFAVAVGSMLGGMLRYGLSTSALARVAVPFPVATFLINISGSFALGFFLTFAATHVGVVGPHVRLAIAVGFLGAYTTFSTFEYETLRLAEEHSFQLALLNVLLSVVVGFAAVWGGAMLARQFEGVRATSNEQHELFKPQADARDPAQGAGAERDRRDSTVEPPRVV